MPYIIRNISKGYQILLKHQVAPGGALDLEDVFEGFCKPKRSKKNQEAKYAEWSTEQFPEFLEKVETEYAMDRGIWRLDFSEDVKGAKKTSTRTRVKIPALVEETAVSKREQKKQELHTARKKIRRAMDDEMMPKELAWLKYNEETKKIISNCSNPQVLKHAIKLARNIAGQERVRDLLDNRLMELGDRLG